MNVNILYLSIILPILVFHIPNVFKVANAPSDFACIRLLPRSAPFDCRVSLIPGQRNTTCGLSLFAIER